MAHEFARSLAEAYATWRLAFGVSVADVQRATRLARHTIENISKGRGRRPLQATLRRLADGLAMDPRTGRYHEDVMKEAYRDLSLAAGYGDPTVADARSLMDLALSYRFRSPSKAHTWAALMDQFEDLEPEQLRALFPPLEPHNAEDLPTD